MNWNTLISAKRFGLEEFHQERHENRSEFQRDYDRLVFSAPFRLYSFVECRRFYVVLARYAIDEQ